MTREEAIFALEYHKLHFATEKGAEAFDMAIKALAQEPILDKIRAEIQGLRNCSCSCSDGIIDDVEDIIDKYNAESEGKKEGLKYCDRNICVSNEYSGIGCDECMVNAESEDKE